MEAGTDIVAFSPHIARALVRTSDIPGRNRGGGEGGGKSRGVGGDQHLPGKRSTVAEGHIRSLHGRAWRLRPRDAELRPLASPYLPLQMPATGRGGGEEEWGGAKTRKKFRKGGWPRKRDGGRGRLQEGKIHGKEGGRGRGGCERSARSWTCRWKGGEGCVYVW